MKYTILTFLFITFNSLGILIFTRCDTWCSICIEQPIYINHIITPTTSGNVASVRLSRPPKGAIISTRVRGQCR